MQRKPEPLKHCQACGKLLVRKRHPSGRLEGFREYRNRKYCDRLCFARSILKAGAPVELDLIQCVPDVRLNPDMDPQRMKTKGRMSYANKKKAGIL